DSKGAARKLARSLAGPPCDAKVAPRMPPMPSSRVTRPPGSERGAPAPAEPAAEAVLLARRVRLVGRVLRTEGEEDVAGGAVALLGHQQLRLVAVLELRIGVLGVLELAVEEHHDVG